ncbi:hypothetical protein RHSIM_Rhsim05G0103700 [Rhododendron simsii]|uniref:Uncharacterized protein n=1 Tax=Rhododendron simsii TaxID=118357 RepID=A0A834GXJ0_RHOSS|nr:hypothetical protein RHSIM_Rhsim05G0103700 [Rhododendron simsii]
MSLVLTAICCVDATDVSVMAAAAATLLVQSAAHSCSAVLLLIMVLCINFLVSCAVISMMARSKAKARKSVVPPMKVQVNKGALVHEGSSSQKEQRKPSAFAVYPRASTICVILLSAVVLAACHFCAVSVVLLMLQLFHIVLSAVMNSSSLLSPAAATVLVVLGLWSVDVLCILMLLFYAAVFCCYINLAAELFWWCPRLLHKVASADADRFKLLLPTSVGYPVRFNLHEVWHREMVFWKMNEDWRASKSTLVRKVRMKEKTSEQFKKDMERIERDKPNSSSTNLKEDALSQVLGPEKRGRLRTFGKGVTLTRLTILSQMNGQFDALREENVQLRSEMSYVKNTVEELKKSQVDWLKEKIDISSLFARDGDHDLASVGR